MTAEKICLDSFEDIDALSKKAKNCVEWVRIQLQAKHPLGQEMTTKFVCWKKDLTGPEVRSIIHYLRLDLLPIGSNSKGYFWATESSELESTRNHLDQRANSNMLMARTISTVMQNMRSGKTKKKDNALW